MTSSGGSDLNLSRLPAGVAVNLSFFVILPRLRRKHVLYELVYLNSLN